MSIDPTNPRSTHGTGVSPNGETLPSPLGLSAEAYAARCVELGMYGGRVGAMERYARFYREGLIEQRGLDVRIAPVVRTHESESVEGTVLKFTQRVPRKLGGEPVVQAGGASLPVLGQAPTEEWLETESVLIPMVGRTKSLSYTLCVSSQVGCAMGCTFCQTAQMGLVRSLTAEEIMGQWFAARHLVKRPNPEAPISNIVFMGMGEPMDNLDNVIAAISVLTDRRGPELAMCKITVSTVGRLDGIAKLAERVHQPGWHRLALAVSLNAPSDEVRSKIMPVNRAMPMADLRAALLKWPFYGGAHLCLEYVLIPGVNDGPLHAAQLAAFFHGEAYPLATSPFREGTPPEADDALVPRYVGGPLRGLINVIPYNPREGSPWDAPTDEGVDQFMTWLKGQGVYCKRRRTKGRDQMAACGQLGNLAYRRKKQAEQGTGRTPV